MNLDDMKTQKPEVVKEVEVEEESTAEEDISTALSILEDCGKFIETILLGMTMSDALKTDVETLLEDIYSFMGQYDITEEKEDSNGD